MTQARTNLALYKPRLREYLVARGITIKTTDKPRIRCLLHADDNPSMILYEQGVKKGLKTGLHCPVCMEPKTLLDIFEAARLILGLPDSRDSFPQVLAEVQSALGEIPGSAPAPARAAVPLPPAADPAPEPARPAYIPLELEESRTYYIKSTILNLASKSLHASVTEIEGTWKNFDPDGKLAFVECRFAAKFFEDGKKKYLTFWFDGQHLRAANPPIKLYNRDKLAANPDADFCIHEGPKSIFGLGDIQGAESIPGMIPTGWNSGGKKFSQCDFEDLRGRNGYFYPDDDKPTDKQPLGEGVATAFRVAGILRDLGCTVRIVKPLAEAPDARAGADIIEALQVRTPEEMAEYIRTGPELEPVPAADSPEANRTTPSLEAVPGQSILPVSPPRPPRGPTPIRTPGDIPFRILGTADDGLTYFIDEGERLQRLKLSSLTKGQLLVLAPLPWWYSEFGHKGKTDWDNATDFVIRAAESVDFDPEVIRGVGAWREPDGRLCYNTGRKVYGEPDPIRLYLRRAEHDIGLDDEPASFAVRREMFNAADQMSFETKADVVRLLAWSILAPFGGALDWRPAGFITGESQSGKSSAMNFIVRKLGDIEICSGMDSTAAGIRQRTRWSSRAVGIEEAGDDSEKALRNRNEIFSLMRQSTGQDAPPAWKGTIDGQGQTFDLEKMFIFAAINPVVNSAADKNRLFFINMIKGTKPWKPIKARLIAAFTDQNCRAVRSWVWAHLAEIIAEAERITDVVEDVGRKSSRDAYLDAILFAAFWHCFKNRSPSDDELAVFVAEAFKVQAPEEKQDDADAIVDRILDEAVPVLGDRGRTYPLRRILYGVKFRKGPLVGDETSQTLDGLRDLTAAEVQAYATTAIQYGLGVDSDGNLAIVNKHHQIARISGLGHGYAPLLWRHACIEDRSRTVSFAKYGDKPRRCTILSGVLETDEIPF